MIRSLRRAALWCGLVLGLMGLAPAHADPALDWAGTVDQVTARLPGARADRARAIAWLAAFNALNAIDPRYRPYAPAPQPVGPGGPAPAPLAALAAALYTALSTEPESDHALLLRRYRETLAAVSAAPERDAGVALGARAALLLLAARSSDRLARVEPAWRDAGPGAYSKPDDAKTGWSATLAGVAPFGVASVAALDPGPPPPTGSEAAQREIAETRALGGSASSARTGDQTAAALFWNSGEPADFTGLITPVLEARKLDALDTARILALDAIINIDSSIAITTFKDRYQHWRPVAAIGGPHAAPADREAGWQPLVRTPGNPQYPSGGGVGSGALEVELPRLMGVAGAVEWRNGQTQQTRRWPDVPTTAAELALARVWAGVHFRSAIDAGRRIGRQIATEVIDRQLLPR